MPEKLGLRMKELIIATGLPKSTILFYVDLGLLSKPIKTSRNMAYYSSDSVERLQFIKSMQRKHRLPLQKIKVLIHMKEQGQDPEPMADMFGLIFGEKGGDRIELEEYSKVTGLNRGVIQELLDAGLLLPLEVGYFDRQDLEMGHMLVEMLQFGIPIADMAVFSKLAQSLVSQEMALHNRMVKDQDLPLEQKITRSIGMLKAARTGRNYMIERLFQRSVLADEDETWLTP